MEVNGSTAEKAAWTYPNPNEKYKRIKNFVAFYPDQLNCFIDGEQAEPQEGHFYGGWITDHIVGPFKGGAGTASW